MVKRLQYLLIFIHILIQYKKQFKSISEISMNVKIETGVNFQ